MALLPVVIFGDNEVILSLDLDAAGTVVGWQCVNNSTTTLLIRITSGQFAVGQAAPAGQTVTASVPKNRQWNWELAEDMMYELSRPGN